MDNTPILPDQEEAKKLLSALGTLSEEDVKEIIKVLYEDRKKR